MVRHLEELGRLLEKRGIPKEKIFIVGGGVLAAKGVRVNDDLDFSFEDDNLRTQYPPKEGERYIKVSENLDSYTDRYVDLGLLDRTIIKKGYFFSAHGYRFVMPEIELALSLSGPRANDEHFTAAAERYILGDAGWNWDLFSTCMRHAAKVQRPYKRTKISSLKAKIKQALSNPGKASRYARHRLALWLEHPDKELMSQLTTKMDTAALLAAHTSNGEFFRYDTLVRYETIGAILNEDRNGIALYKEMQRKRKREDKLETFTRLIKSVKERGLLNSNPILLSKDGPMVHGSHRLACALYFGIQEIPVLVSYTERAGGRDYGREWFKEHGFDPSVIKRLDALKRRIFLEQGLYFPVIIWPPAREHFAAIAGDIRTRYNVLFETELALGSCVGEFIRDVYATDDIAQWKVDLKTYLMQKYEPAAYIMLLEVPHPHYRVKSPNGSISIAMEDLKKSIRGAYKGKIADYFYDIILHTGDNYKQNREILELIKRDGNISISESDLRGEQESE